VADRYYDNLQAQLATERDALKIVGENLAEYKERLVKKRGKKRFHKLKRREAEAGGLLRTSSRSSLSLLLLLLLLRSSV